MHAKRKMKIFIKAPDTPTQKHRAKMNIEEIVTEHRAQCSSSGDIAVQ